ncbi:MAG TPA: transaldolase [Dehalococcoidales bacterium]
MNNIQALQTLGQSIWLDLISRSLLTSGELKNLIDQGVTGVTSNPSIFQKSICDTQDYDQAISSILKSQPEIDINSLYEKIAIEDIQAAADLLKPIYDSGEGTDGFVSLEVSPQLSALTASTVSEAQRLWKAVDRPNLLIKVPATPEGIPAIEELIAGGINVNATLTFSLAQYEAVAYAYIRGLGSNPNPRPVASVASFFVSRIDTAVDKLLDKAGTPAAAELKGQAAVACAKLVYKRFNEIFYDTPFDPQRKRDARVQKIVWGSTGTKNPQYSDVLYVDEIIGPDTINTIPMPTLKAFLDHGQVRPSLMEDVEEAGQVLTKLAKLNVDLNAITNQLLKDGVQAFVQSYDQMLDSLRGRCGLGKQG